MDAQLTETAARLRGKHIRTLEVTQQLSDENRVLRSQLEAVDGLTLVVLLKDLETAKETAKEALSACQEECRVKVGTH